MKANNNRIWVISLTDVPNGAENVLLKVAVAIKADLIFVKKNTGPTLAVPAHLSKRFLSQSTIVFGLLKLIPLMGQFKRGEIIMSSHPYLNAFLGFFKKLGFIKSKLIARECTSVFTRYTGLKKLVYQLIYRFGYPAVDLVVCQTELMKADLLQHNQFIAENKVWVQANPVDIKELRLQAIQPLAKEEQQASFICAAGRLITEKGFDVLIKAFEMIHGQNPGLRLFILGEGKQKSALQQLAMSYKLAEHIVFKGHVVLPAPYFKQARLCVVSSIKEGFPNVLLEMMALNQSVVSTLCAGGINAIPYIEKVEVNNVAALATAIQNMLNKSVMPNYNPCTAYLRQRSPQVFTHAILNKLAAQN